MAPLPAPAEKPSHRVSDSQSHAKFSPPAQVAVFCAALWPNLQPALTALNELRTGIIEQRQRWVIDADISKYFDSITHSHLRSFLDLRIKDGVARRMIDKWLKAGVLEEDALHRPVAGTPQGGVISPMLSNIFLHQVLDEWFENVAKPRLHGRCQLVRFADDFVIAFEDRHSGKRMLDVLGKRLGRYGLTLHETKTRYVDFRRRRPYGRHWMASATTFDFLGFTHVWGRSMQGKDVVRQITAKGRFARALKSVHDWCKRYRHLPIEAQRDHLAKESLNNPMFAVSRGRGGLDVKLDDIADRPGAALVTGYGANGRYPRRSAFFPAVPPAAGRLLPCHPVA